MSSAAPLLVGLIALYAAIAVAVVAVIGRAKRVPVERRTAAAPVTLQPSFNDERDGVAGVLDSGLARLGLTDRLTAALDNAGLATSPARFAVIALGGVVSAVAAGWTLAGALAALLFGAIAALVVRMVVSIAASRRRAAFADQLDDSLQLLASSLRAGHSLLRAIDAVSTEADTPTSAEFSRIINETRVGRDLGQALDESALRMASDDFAWVSQAIAIHREVGGDLAEVLDTVCHTIRERNQIRRQVRALSAEGRMSGMVLMLLPIGVTSVLFTTNPGYLLKLTTSGLGWALIFAAVGMLVAGGLWLRKVVSFSF